MASYAHQTILDNSFSFQLLQLLPLTDSVYFYFYSLNVLLFIHLSIPNFAILIFWICCNYSTPRPVKLGMLELMSFFYYDKPDQFTIAYILIQLHCNLIRLQMVTLEASQINVFFTSRYCHTMSKIENSSNQLLWKPIC